MSLLPSQIVSRVALRIGAFLGIPATIDTSYANPFANMISAGVTPNSIRADILMIEQEMATIVAMNKLQPWRDLLADVTASIASGGLVPSTGSGGGKIIGRYGSVRDSSDLKWCTDKFTTEEIRRLIDNANSWRKLNLYAFALNPPRITHTRPSVIIDVCVFDFDARKTAIDADQALIFQSAADMYFFGCMSLLANTDAKLTELSSFYSKGYDLWRQALTTGVNEVKAAA
jgi:hypothetical protein